VSPHGDAQLPHQHVRTGSSELWPELVVGWGHAPTQFRSDALQARRQSSDVLQSESASHAWTSEPQLESTQLEQPPPPLPDEPLLDVEQPGRVANDSTSAAAELRSQGAGFERIMTRV
jgi:hypothetical protein